MTCPLCNSKKNNILFIDQQKEFHICEHCNLIFVPCQFHPTLEDEKQRYLLHTNDFSDIGYVKYLTNIAKHFSLYCNDVNKNIIDYGCGENAVLANILHKIGYKNIDIYDPLFYPSGLLKKKYDAIILCEVAEHFRNPFLEFEKILSLMNEDSLLYIRTHMTDNIKDIKNWWYIKDITHIAFYSLKTIKYISKRFNFNILDISDNYIVFKKLG